MIERLKAVEATYPIPGWLWPREIGAIYDLCHGSQRHVEVGSYCGRSLYAACAALGEKASVTAIDPCLAEKCGEQPAPQWSLAVFRCTLSAIAEIRPDLKVEHWQTDSLAAAITWKGSISSLYLDGAHEFAEVSADLQAWWPHVEPGGIMLGHDYWAVTPGVVEAVQEFFGREGRTFEVVPQTRIWWSRKPKLMTT